MTNKRGSALAWILAIVIIILILIVAAIIYYISQGDSSSAGSLLNTAGNSIPSPPALPSD